MKLPRNDLDQNYTVVYFFLNKMYKINNHMKSAQVFSQTFLFFFFFSCHQRPIIYQFMKIWAGGVQLPLIAE